MVRKRLPSFIFPPNPGLPGLSDFEFVFKSLGANLTDAAQLHDSLIKIQAATYRTMVWVFYNLRLYFINR